jgi:hypothetical protein
VLEALCLLEGLGATAPPGGPLSEQSGVFWIELPDAAEPAARDRLPRLGYSVAVDRLTPVPERASPRGERLPRVRWRGGSYRIERLYEEDAEATRESAPDRREFLFEDRAGRVRSVRGYRGDGEATSRRGLPVCDARMLVNLVAWQQTFRPKVGGALLDPFAGAGGIVREALACGARVASVDVDPALRHGLAALGASHCVADARRLPFGGSTFDGAATEPPYHPEIEGVVRAGLRELARVVRAEGRIAMLCAAGHAPGLRQEADALGLRARLDSPIDRKGLGVIALMWERSAGAL